MPKPSDETVLMILTILELLGKRETQHQIMLRYLQRTHVLLRVEGGRRQQILALTQVLEERRKR